MPCQVCGMLSEANSALLHGVIHVTSNLLGDLVFHLWTAFGQRPQAVGISTGKVHFLAVSLNSFHPKFQLFLVPVLAVNSTMIGTICSSVADTIPVSNTLPVSLIH